MYKRQALKSPGGRIAKCPPSGSRTRANTAGPSKRGKQSQSTEPARLTSAAERLLLSGPDDWRVDGATASARLHVTAGQTVSFALAHGRMSEPPLAAWDGDEIAARLEDTLEGGEAVIAGVAAKPAQAVGS